jgi:NAD(P)-dependent dehydrogenase (short-subunit alcohol dehydrogenase family)
VVVNLRFKGVYFLTQKLLPRMNDGGCIVNTSSGPARISIPGSSHMQRQKRQSNFSLCTL